MISSHPRTILFTPALRLDRYESALRGEADICLLDLEDSVSFSAKKLARENFVKFFNDSNIAPFINKTAVRINALNSTEGLEDLVALASMVSNIPNYIVIPKCESSKQLNQVSDLLSKREDDYSLIALIESAAGVNNLDEIVLNSNKLKGLMFGSADYTRDINAEICWDSVLFARTMIVQAASKNKISSIDTPYFDIPDILGLEEECKKVKMLGFTGRCVIHPEQTKIINKCFSHSSEVIKRSIKIVEEASKNNGNICKVDGQMVGAPIIAQAKKILTEAGIINE